MILIFIGPPGAGKGTQAALIAAKLSLPVVSTGEILRAKASSDTPEAIELKKILDSGKLVPSVGVNQFVLEYLNSVTNGCILDGYPRSLDQAEFLSKNIKQPIKVLYFDISSDVLVKRITGRFSCSDCGRIYNKYFSPTKTEGKCDICGSEEFTYRSDDNELTVRSRLETYEKQTMPVVDYYKKLNSLEVVDAAKSVKKITEDLVSILKSD